ncbi:hypothetical protein ACJIZ3_008332 [Penstemon smallii]|uniref:SPARK domain-containing protein n=1 Tax=Penstemon smallii TaxID=265156 RepID=A0ABD3TAF7_9LAMI
MSRAIITCLCTFLFTTFQIRALPVLPDPDPATVQTQTLHPSPTIPSTIPAFPEQSDASACPLELPDDLFHGIKSACGSKHHHRQLPDPNSYSGQLHRTRCCPVLAAYLYSAYSKTALRTGLTNTTQPRTASYDMPVLPEDSETCVDTLEKALGNRGIELGKTNETCDVVYCYCGIRLHRFSCPEAFSVDSRGRLSGGAAVKKLEKDCFNGGGYSGLAGCSNCLNSLYLLHENKGGRSNNSERTGKMHNRDCELMGLTWLLNKDRSAYIHTVSAVLRALMMSEDEESGPLFCSLNSDGMPLAVDSSEIDAKSSSMILEVIRLHQYLLATIFFFMYV